MTLILSGTDGVSDIDGTAATPAIRGTDANTGIFFPAADTIAFAEGGAEAMRIDSSGNVGIGTTNPLDPLHVSTGSTTTYVRISNSGGERMLLSQESGASGIYAQNSVGTSSVLKLATGSTERMRIDSSGNVLIGTTTASGYSLGSVYNATTKNAGFVFQNSTTGQTDSDGLFVGIGLGGGADASTAYFYNRENGPAVFATNNTERMRITSGGRLGLGATSPLDNFEVQDTAGVSMGLNINSAGSTGSPKYASFYFRGYLGNRLGGIQMFDQSASTAASGPMIFYNNTNLAADVVSERARITSDGNLWIGTTTALTGVTLTRLAVATSAADYSAAFESQSNTAANCYGPIIRFLNATPNDTAQSFLSCVDSTNAKCIIYSNGTVTNRTGTYNSFSDLKLKQDVVDASSQWDDIKALRIVKYRLKDEVAADPNYPAYIGVIAQEVEQVSPGLIDNCPDFENVEVTDEEGNVTTKRQPTGTVTKSVKSSIIYMKAVKALQEAMTRIEALEAQNAAFEARLAALEAK